VYDARKMTGPVKTTVTVPFTLVQSTDVAGLRAGTEKDIWVSGLVVRIDRFPAGWNIHLDAATDVFVYLNAGADRDQLVRREERGDRVVGKRIAFRGKPRDLGKSIRIDLSHKVDAITILD
jgi:hypothetical protein